MSSDDLSGAVLDGRYRVIEPIAEGAMGVVYRAERMKLGRIVAIKVLHDQLPAELSSRKRFEIEATAMARLEHPHCAAVLDVGVHDEKPYVVMDFVSGRNLKDIISDGPVPLGRAVEIVRQVLSGLAHAHEHGIIHRDIKPANVVLSQKAGLGDHVKILDFGLARLTNSDVSNLTTGIVVGTPAYMAPEQIRGVQIDHRADVYACGVLLFELLTGQKPFVSAKDDPIEVCSMHLKSVPPRLVDKQPGITFGELENVVVKALAKSAADRYASAEEFAAALDEIMPRKRAMTPIAGIAVSGLANASPSGWAVPADSAPHAGGPNAPVVVAPSGPNAASPNADSASPDGSASPHAAPSAAAVPSVPSVAAAPSGPSAASVPNAVLIEPSAPSVAATEHAEPSGMAPAATARPSLPPDFNLSIAIPREQAAAVEPPVSDDEPPRTESVQDIRETVAFMGAPPAGPSPLAIRDAAPIAEPPPPKPLPPKPRFTQKQLTYVAGGVLLLVTVIALIAVARRGGSSSTAAIPADAAPKPSTPVVGPVDEQLARARDLVAAGKVETALDLLLAARKVFPTDARVAFAVGKLYMDKQWWPHGLRHFRYAIQLDSKFRSDEQLIKSVLKAFLTPRDYPVSFGSFLRNEIGAPARPFLEETERSHPKAHVRARATAELRKMR